MRSPVVFLVTTAAFFPTYAFQLPFNIQLPFFSSGSQAPLIAPAEPADAPIPNRIAIIGAGAGGSSAAFWVSKAKERFGLDVEVDVYDKNTYIGGRSTVVSPYDNLQPIELGGSIFVKANKNLWRAVEEFGLERSDFEDEKSVMGIWDGQEFVLTTGGSSFYSDWLDKIKILWRYGYNAPSKTQALVGEMIDGFLKLYEPSTPRWSNISQVVSEMGWDDVVAKSMSEYLDFQGIDRRWTRELVEAATRVNYGQNADKIHALEGLVSLAASGAASVKGGNYQIFKHFLEASNASLYLNTTVKSVTRAASGAWVIHSAASQKPRTYRSVILAAPYHQTGISFSNEALVAQVPSQPYVHLHVTLLTTLSSVPNPAYFGLKSGTPTMVLTTFEGVRQRGEPAPEFNSLSYHGAYSMSEGNSSNTTAEEGREQKSDSKLSVVKIFSEERVEDAWLEQMFGSVDWVLRKEWEAYPVLPPTSEFPPVKLAEGLYYVNAFEPLISTMETETIASRNVVELLMKEQYDAGLCPPRAEEDAEAPLKDDFVYGWDC